jgi:hypothetical protein
MQQPSIIDRCTNMNGSLRGEIRERLAAALRDPTQETWEAAYSIIVAYPARNQTLWQAWITVDPGAPLIGPMNGKPWASIPDKLTLRRAVEVALRERDTRLRVGKEG